MKLVFGLMLAVLASSSRCSECRAKLGYARCVSTCGADAESCRRCRKAFGLNAGIYCGESCAGQLSPVQEQVLSMAQRCAECRSKLGYARCVSTCGGDAEACSRCRKSFGVNAGIYCGASCSGTVPAPASQVQAQELSYAQRCAECRERLGYAACVPTCGGDAEACRRCQKAHGMNAGIYCGASCSGARVAPVSQVETQELSYAQRCSECRQKLGYAACVSTCGADAESCRRCRKAYGTNAGIYCGASCAGQILRQVQEQALSYAQRCADCRKKLGYARCVSTCGADAESCSRCRKAYGQNAGIYCGASCAGQVPLKSQLQVQDLSYAQRCADCRAKLGYAACVSTCGADAESCSRCRKAFGLNAGIYCGASCAGQLQPLAWRRLLRKVAWAAAKKLDFDL